MKKIALPILFLLVLASCGKKSDKLIGLWLLDHQDTLVYKKSFGDVWQGELSAVEIYEKNGILFFDSDYTNTKNEHTVLIVSEDKISMQTFSGQSISSSERVEILLRWQMTFTKK